jgi:5-methylcytosine-specific restriction endonuclease McrA
MVNSRRKRTVGRGAEYYAYLRSPEWADVKRRYLASKLPNWCYVCADLLVRGTCEFHHRTYQRLGNETLWDIVPVCRGCHERVHDRMKRKVAGRAANGLNRPTAWRESKLLWQATEQEREHRWKHAPAPSPDELARTPHTRRNLERWGVSWPPRKHWQKVLLRKWSRTPNRGTDAVVSPSVRSIAQK